MRREFAQRRVGGHDLRQALIEGRAVLDGLRRAEAAELGGDASEVWFSHVRILAVDQTTKDAKSTKVFGSQRRPRMTAHLFRSTFVIFVLFVVRSCLRVLGGDSYFLCFWTKARMRCQASLAASACSLKLRSKKLCGAPG